MQEVIAILVLALLADLNNAKQDESRFGPRVLLPADEVHGRLTPEAQHEALVLRLQLEATVFTLEAGGAQRNLR